MSSSDNSVAGRSSTYLNSLVDYVLEVKPFRTKINSRSGAVAEIYLFSDNLNVTVRDFIPQQTVFLGADTLDKNTIVQLSDVERAQYGLRGFARPQSNSWYQEIVSDGQRLVWPIANLSIPKFSSSSSSQTFVSGVRTVSHNPEDGIVALPRLDDYQGITGLTRGVFDQRRSDALTITEVKKNDIHQHDSVDYFVSHGVFSFDVIPPNGSIVQRWIPHTVNPNPINPPDIFDPLDPLGEQTWDEEFLLSSLPFSGDDAKSHYSDNTTTFGTIRDITDGNFEEWVIEITQLVLNVSVTVNITGYQNGDITTPTVQHVFNWPSATPQLYSGANVSFFYQQNPQPLDDTDPIIGGRWILTPFSKITISDSAPEETWSLIKTNPSVFISGGKPIFTPVSARSEYPSVSIHTTMMGNAISTSGEIPWDIQFLSNTSYSLNCNGLLPGYPKTISLEDGCSYRDEYIGFTLIPTSDGWEAGDIFNWTTSSKPTHYKVYGSISGWQQDATVGQWYWNGLIGFKIPELSYFATSFNTTVAKTLLGGQGSWETVINSDQMVEDISFQNGAFLLSGNNSIVGGSLDGQEWTSYLDNILTLTGNDYFLITSSDGDVYMSSDGVNWSVTSISIAGNLNDSIYLPNFLASPGSLVNDLNCLIVVGDGGEIATSAVGFGWDLQTTPTSENLNAITISNEFIVVVGDNGTILTSTDRDTWTARTSPTTNNLRDVVFVDNGSASGILTAVGDNGTIIRSTDGGVNWVDLAVYNSGQFNSIAYGNGKYIVVGLSSHIAESEDGLNWVRYSSKPFNDIAFGNGTFIAVGGSTSAAPTQFFPLTDINVMAVPSTYRVVFTQPTSTITSFTYTITSATYIIDGADDNAHVFRISPDDVSAVTVLVNGNPVSNITIENNKINFVNQLVPGDAVSVTSPPFNGSATVFNEHYGYGKSLHANNAWADEYVSFRLDTIPGFFEFNIGDQVDILTAPAYTFVNNNIDDTVPLLLNSEIFPLQHSEGAVIFPVIDDGDIVIIDKCFYDKIFLKIVGASANHPELGAKNDSVPLYFKFHDKLNNGVPSSNAEYSDLATFIEAFSVGTGQHVFSILNPRHAKTNRSAQSTLTFNKSFVDKYLPMNTRYSINVLPDASYSQHIKVKVTENLKIYDRVKMNLFDIMLVEISDDWANSDFTEIVSALYFSDGPATGFWKYQIVDISAGPPYAYNLVFFGPGDAVNHQVWDYPFSISMSEGGAILLDDYDTHGYDDGLYDERSYEFVNNGFPGIELEHSVVSTREDEGDLSSDAIGESANTGVAEGLFILQSLVAESTTLYHARFDFNQTQPIGETVPSVDTGLTITQASDVYRVDLVNKPASATTWMVANESSLGTAESDSIVYLSYVGGTITDPFTFEFSLPAGISVPFRLWIT